MTGYRAFSYLFVKSFPVLSKGFEIETEMTIHAVVNNMSTANVVIGYQDRPAGSFSKLNTVRDGIKVLKTILKLFKNYKPLCFFGLLGTILFLVACGFFVPVLLTYLDTGLVPNFPTLIACGFMALAGIVSFFSGMVLDTLWQHHRHEFEFKLQVIQQLRGRAANSSMKNQVF